MRGFLCVLLAFVTLTARADPAGAQTGNARELKAAELFAAGDYQKSLSIFITLYAEDPHPTYMRNIARCYQNLRQPAKAIASFRDYLRTAKDLTPDKRAAIDAHIYEMEQLQNAQAKQAEDVRPVPVEAPAPAASVTPSVSPPSSILVEPAPPEPTTQVTSNRGRVVSLVLLGVAGALTVAGIWARSDAWSKYNKAESDGCPHTGTECASRADEVRSRTRLTYALFAGAAVSAAASTTIFLLNPTNTQDDHRSDVGLVVGMRRRF